MTGNIDVVVRALRSVRHSAIEIRYRQAVLLAELTSPRAALVAVATVQLYDAVEIFESTVRRLQTIAAELDRELGRHLIASLGELVLHLRVFAILSEVEQLTQALYSPGVEIHALFTERIRSVSDVSALVCERIDRVWLEYGHLIRGPGGSVCRDVVREAQCALTMIGDDPDLMHLLRVGMAHPDLPGVFCACANIAELLELAIDIEPDAALFHATPNPELIDDLPPAMRGGIRREDGKR